MTSLQLLVGTARETLLPNTRRIDRHKDTRELLAFTQRMYAGYEAPHHIREIARHLERIADDDDPLNRLIITMPPRHGKSLLASEHFPAWYLGRNPNNRVIACSHTALLAYTFSRLSRGKIDNPKWPFKDVKIASDKGAVQSWDLQGWRGGLTAAGVRGPIVGLGANLLVIDDPVKSAQDANSQTIRDATWEWYTGNAYTRLEPGGKIVVIGTRWHEDDLIGRLIASDEEWEVLHLPAINESGQALWPERYSIDDLERIKTTIGSYNFEAQYQGGPTSVEGGTFKRHWWRYWKPQGSNLPPVPVKMPDGTTQYINAIDLPNIHDRSATSWDMTFKATEDGSYVVGLTGIRLNAWAYITDMYRDRPDFVGTINAVQTQSHKHGNVATQLIEEAANGAAVIDSLKYRVPGIVPVPVRGSKEVRANASTPHVEAGNYYLPHPALYPWVETFINEMASFPTGSNDDIVDAFSQLDHYLYREMDVLREPTGNLAAYLRRQ